MQVEFNNDNNNRGHRIIHPEQSDKKQFVDFYNILIIFFIVCTTLFNKSGCKEASILDFLPSNGFSVQIF